MGAAVALEFALRRPPSLKGLVLASVGCRVAIPKEWLASLRQGITPFEMVVQSFHPMPYTFWQKEHAMDTNRCPQPVRYLDYLALNSFERREELEQLRVPTLILRGGSDAVVNEDGVAELHRRIRGSTIEIVRGGGHALSVLKPHEVSTAINRFIADHIWRASDTDQVGEPADGRSSVMAPRWRDG